MKDRIGNKLAVGDKVMVALPESAIIGFVAQVQETGLVARVRGGGADTAPGHVLVSCVVQLPADTLMGAVAQLVKVYDADRPVEAAEPSKGTDDASKVN